MKPKLLPDPHKDAGVTKDGHRLFVVKLMEPLSSGHWLTQEEMKIKKSDFPSDTVFIYGQRDYVNLQTQSRKQEKV